MKVLARSAAVAAAATALIATTTPLAAAGSGFEVWTDAESSRECGVANEAGSAKFVDDGEHFYIDDRRSDGHSVRAHVYVNGDFKETLKSTGTSSSPATHYNRSYPEGAKVTVGVYVSYYNQVCGYDEESGTA
ncbi:hypothetical protein [Solicola gregarius]|uniref:Uncharacterized protein n=1 Tax=Solicola gregarius TaxID=2908642 RepID=A0AA46TJP4_9ACTN|nr:hypothetical protein [Solicola gregarius]UYM06516.1 hypothetical protein L0C25_05435 [Solicola gregarius]